jgi:hypothetical protein
MPEEVVEMLDDRPMKVNQIPRLKLCICAHRPPGLLGCSNSPIWVSLGACCNNFTV